MTLSFYGHDFPVTRTANWTDMADDVRAVTGGKGSKIRRCTDGRPRTRGWSSGLVLHTTSGTARKVQPGLIDSVRDWIYSQYQTSTDREVSWHMTVDLDGSAIQQAGPEWMCWHASQVNASTDGWELVEGAGGVLTQVQLDRVVELVDHWTWHTGIPRIIPYRGGKPFAGMLTRALSAHGAGISLACVYGHRNVWRVGKETGRLCPYRGVGDPSDLPFLALERAGYKCLDVETGEDLAIFKALQSRMGLDPDGVWGLASRKAFWKEQGRALLADRPGDAARGIPAFAR